MKLEIVSPDGILFEGEAERVSFPGMVGSFDILPIMPANSRPPTGSHPI